jgi:hypothetical protein
MSQNWMPSILGQVGEDLQLPLWPVIIMTPLPASSPLEVLLALDHDMDLISVRP